jgi:hypothetical protein
MNKLHFLWNFTFAATQDNFSRGWGKPSSKTFSCHMCARLPDSGCRSRAVTILSIVKVHKEFRIARPLAMIMIMPLCPVT